jgi:hypothetical protein
MGHIGANNTFYQLAGMDIDGLHGRAFRAAQRCLERLRNCLETVSARFRTVYNGLERLGPGLSCSKLSSGGAGDAIAGADIDQRVADDVHGLFGGFPTPALAAN